MFAQVHFTGPVQYRIRIPVQIGRSVVEVSARRMLKGPRCHTWNWSVELCTQVLKVLVRTALQMGSVQEARRYLNSVVVTSPVLSEFQITPVVETNLRGSWFTHKRSPSDVTLLYLHGGGYSFYPQTYENLIALVTRAARARTFALDYRLTPEHQFPAQLEDALNAYRWLLAKGSKPQNLVVGGDSAGGNLTLALLLALREVSLPPPALALALSPATDFQAEIVDTDLDWLDTRALLHWANCFCTSAERITPLVSPLRANLRGLPPIYIQAGRAEILFPSIQAFADHAEHQAADVVLESWEDMPHVFQVFGLHAPQSQAALERIGEIVDLRVRANNCPAVWTK